MSIINNEFFPGEIVPGTQVRRKAPLRGAREGYRQCKKAVVCSFL